jgi:hypothetical protein
MDTRFWGPSGWKLLHTITFAYPQNPVVEDKRNMNRFLETLPYILPCKFCRASLTEYYEKHPYENALESRAKFTHWLYKIHNEVNAKLREQNLNPSSDPTFQDVKHFYENFQKEPADAILTTYWDFLFSVAYNHPKETTKASKPMPNCPASAFTCRSKKEKNRWNTLGMEDRMYYYTQFWKYLPDILPNSIAKLWNDAYKKESMCLQSRRTTVAWLWRMRCKIDANFKDPYTEVCRAIASHASGCSKSLRAKTCRRHRK